MEDAEKYLGGCVTFRIMDAVATKVCEEEIIRQLALISHFTHYYSNMEAI